MRTRVLLLLALATSLAADCATPPTVEPAPVVERDARLIDGDLGSHSPAQADVDLAARLGGPGGEAALAEIEALPTAEMITVLRTGLRLRDADAASVCAGNLHWGWTDGWEQRRCVDLLTPNVLLMDSAYFENYRRMLASTEVPRLLEELPPTPWTVEPRLVLGALHRSLRADHLPQLIRLARSDDPEIRVGAISNIDLLGMWTDRMRPECASVFLGLPADAAVGTGADGLHPLLHRYLSLRLLGTGGQAAGSPRRRRWWMRWARDSVPGPQDALLLAACVLDDDADWEDAPQLWRLFDQLDPMPAEEAWLRIGAAADVRWVPMARMGGREALAAEEFESTGDPLALAVVMECRPEQARELLIERLFGADEGLALSTAMALRELMDPALVGADDEGVRWRNTDLTGLADRVETAPMSRRRRTILAMTLPGCRTHRAARAVCVAMAHESLVADEDAPHIDNMLGFLDLGAPDELRRALRNVAADATRNEDDREGALETLLLLGDPESAGMLIERFGDDEDALIGIARSPSPESVAFLEERVRADPTGEALRALAVVHGLSQRVDWLDGEPAPGVVDALMGGRVADAVVLQVQATPDEDLYMDGLGLVDDPRLRAHLLRVRDRRELDSYWWATGELAVMGDPGARAEFWQAMTDGRYGVMNEAEEGARTLGFDLSTVPFLISELESQCCRITTSMAGNVFEDLFDIDAYDTPNRTSFDRLSQFWSMHEGRFGWSRAEGHFVPLPR